MADIRFSTAINDDFQRADENPIAYPWVHPANWDLAPILESGSLTSPSFDPNNQAFAYFDLFPQSVDNIEAWGVASGDQPLHEAHYWGLTTTSETGYYARSANSVGPDPWSIIRLDGGFAGGTIAAGVIPHNLINGDLALMQIVGSVISCYLSTDGGANWTLMVSASDTTYRTDLHVAFGSQGGGPGWTEVGGRQPEPRQQIYRILHGTTDLPRPPV